MNFKNVLIFFLVCSLKSFGFHNTAAENYSSVAFVVSQNDSIQKHELQKTLQLAKIKFEEKKTEEALKLYLEIIEKAKVSDHKKTLTECYSQVSKIFRSIKSYRKAMLYNKKSLEQAILLKDTIEIIERNLNTAALHHKLYVTDSISNPKSVDSLIYYNNQAAKVINNNPKYKQQQAYYYSVLSIISFHKKKYHLGINQIKKSIGIEIELKDTLGEVNGYNTLAGNYIKLKNYREAIIYYEKAILLLDKYTAESDPKRKRMLYSNLAWAYYNTKNHISYDYLAKANRIVDSLRNAEFDAILNEIEAKHNGDIIRENAAKKQLIEVQKKKRFQAYSIGLGICLCILLYLFWTYSVNTKLKHENNDLLFLKNKLIKEKEIEQLESQTRIKVLNATLDGKETERKQIAQTLHDSVSALLSAANLHLQASKSQYKGKTPIEIDKTQKIIDEASGKIRNLSHELISSVLLKFGLSYAIQDLCEKYSNSQLEISCSTENLQRYQEGFEIKINNIIEELVNNLIKHSNASEGFVSIMEYQKRLYVEIQDNGIGFDPSKKLKSEGIGIHQIEARINMLKGTFKVSSEMNKGTKIEFMVPIFYRPSVIV
jgi:signal transduction histidine kinase